MVSEVVGFSKHFHWSLYIFHFLTVRILGQDHKKQKGGGWKERKCSLLTPPYCLRFFLSGVFLVSKDVKMVSEVVGFC